MNQISPVKALPKHPALIDMLRACDQVAVALSGGVDSMTLSTYAHRLLGRERVHVIHAVSPAVPEAATRRVREHARREGWRLDIVDAGEFADARYRENPVNRCYFCKLNLYDMLLRVADGTILSGTNTDDLSDYRPGLLAASEKKVRHPFVEAGLAKTDVRVLAKLLGLGSVANLPAAPCLASRVETGIRVEPETLTLIDRMETWFRDEHGALTVRCRYRRMGWVIELDSETLARINGLPSPAIVATLRLQFPEIQGAALSIAPYQRGSAFLGAPR